MAAKNNNQTILLAAVVVAAIGGGAFLFMQNKNKQVQGGPGDDRTAEYDAAARIAEANARERELELQSEIAKQQLKALDVPLEKQIIGGILDTAKIFVGGIAGNIKF